MKITDFLVMDHYGDQIDADPHGNNIAFCCFDCGHPILAVALENQRGFDEVHPAACRGCKVKYFLDIRSNAGKLYIHRMCGRRALQTRTAREARAVRCCQSRGAFSPAADHSIGWSSISWRAKRTGGAP